MNNIIDKNKKQKSVLKKKNVPLFPTDFSKFDPATGDKIAEQQMNLARLEALSDAKGARTSATNKEETLKDAATGGSLSYLVGNSAITKDSNRIKSLTALRKKGLIGIAGALGAGVLSLRKQKGEYNRQQASRELLVGKETDRSTAYKNYLEKKYNLRAQ